MSNLLNVLIEQDRMSYLDAKLLIKELKDRVFDGEDPEEILYEELDLEPDYIFDLL